MLLHVLLQAPRNHQQHCHPREEVESYLSLVLDMAEAMCARGLPRAFFRNYSSAEPPEDPRVRMVGDLRSIIKSF